MNKNEQRPWWWLASVLGVGLAWAFGGLILWCGFIWLCLWLLSSMGCDMP